MLKLLLPYSKRFRLNKISVGVLCPYLETSLHNMTRAYIDFYDIMRTFLNLEQFVYDNIHKVSEKTTYYGYINQLPNKHVI